MTGLKREMTGLMEVNVPPTLCPNHEAVIAVFSPSQRSPCPSLLNIVLYMILRKKLSSAYVPLSRPHILVFFL
jgi:hypothetical protein